MKRLKVYLDTSVISYLYQLDTLEKMKETRKLWEIFKEKNIYEVYISDIVLAELNGCQEEKLRVLLEYVNEIDYNIIKTDKNTIELAEKFVGLGILKQKCFNDCQHIAAAILEGCDIIVSWNFKHIVNVNTVRGVKVITTMEGYKDLLICSPSFLLEEEDECNDETNNKFIF